MTQQKSILVTGAGSGFGKAAAIGMAKNGHHIIATAQVSSQVTPLREEVKALGLSEKIRIERLDLTDPYDIKQAQGWDIDIATVHLGSSAKKVTNWPRDSFLRKTTLPSLAAA
ncbi:short subunit dehydrogenase [Neorhizobium sp. JUb45]|nr:short subunit dehydrogenase [Neorhizobium sp. JUb45]